ncbi:hypothetical protein BABINDRAFT_20958, partial [Babjeviella inositovora NRRL Y-12698]
FRVRNKQRSVHPSESIGVFLNESFFKFFLAVIDARRMRNISTERLHPSRDTWMTGAMRRKSAKESTSTSDGLVLVSSSTGRGSMAPLGICLSVPGIGRISRR